MTSLNKYIKESSNKIRSNLKEYNLFNKVIVYVTHPLPSKINMVNVISQIEKMIPSQLMRSVDNIFIGHFDIFSKRDINALYSDGAIYVTNRQSSEEDLIDDIIHEVAHSIEEDFALEIYSDGLVAKEFTSKRKSLKNKLDGIGFNEPLELFLDLDYSTEFDVFLYKKVGYKKLSALTSDIFISPYAATSLREYFATGFEYYYLQNNHLLLKKTCPMLYNILDNLLDTSYNE